MAASADESTSHANYIRRDNRKALSALFMEELRSAKSAGQQPIVVFTADWCSPCRVIHDFLDESSEVQRQTRKGRFLFIDVDEWRGPAHRLIAGINPTKLPTLVRVDYKGAAVESCFGTELGLLSEKSVASNLKRLIDGKGPAPPFYAKDPKLRTQLIRQQNKANEDRVAGVPAVEADVISATGGVWKLRITVRNQKAPRRWFVVPTSLEVPLDTEPSIRRWELMRFSDHVRAQYLRFYGEPGFVVLPVAGYGSVEIGEFEVRGSMRGGMLDVWELTAVTVDGEARKFEKKVPHDLKVSKASDARVLQSSGSGEVKMKVRKRHRVMLDP